MTKFNFENTTDAQLDGLLAENARDEGRLRKKLQDLRADREKIESEKRRRLVERESKKEGPLAAFQKLWKELDDLMLKHARVGACDTEPRRQRTNALRRAYENGEKKIPKSARDWELFSGEKGAGAAAKELHSACSKLVTAFLKLPHDQAVAMARYYGFD